MKQSLGPLPQPEYSGQAHKSRCRWSSSQGIRYQRRNPGSFQTIHLVGQQSLESLEEPKDLPGVRQNLDIGQAQVTGGAYQPIPQGLSLHHRVEQGVDREYLGGPSSNVPLNIEPLVPYGSATNWGVPGDRLHPPRTAHASEGTAEARLAPDDIIRRSATDEVPSRQYKPKKVSDFDGKSSW